jgi:hypothetical protein
MLRKRTVSENRLSSSNKSDGEIMKKIAMPLILVALLGQIFMGQIANAEETTESTVTTQLTSTTTASSTTAEITTTTDAPDDSADTTTTPSSVESTTTTFTPTPQSCPTDVCGWAVVADDGTVHGVIVCNNWCAGKTLPGYMGCENGCRLIVQGQQTEDGNVAGWHGSGVKYNDDTGRFTLPNDGHIDAGARMGDAYFPTTTIAEVVPQPEEGVSTTTTIPEGELQYLTLPQFYAMQEAKGVARKVFVAKRYSSCTAMRRDFPGGVQLSEKAQDVVTGKAVFRVSIPVVHKSMYLLNSRFDTDNDKVACELWQSVAKRPSGKNLRVSK